MELHESLYALGRSQGRELFNDADSFRGALDDYLDENSATTGDINLLVDAVRLGAFQSMATMLDSGADAQRAVADAGARLARDRGSSDVGGAMWACAALGYAIGKVSDADVRRYRTQHSSQGSPPPVGPATVLPPSQTGPSAPSAGATQRPFAPPAGAPTGAPSAGAPAWPNSGGGSGGVPGSYPAPQQGGPYSPQFASFSAPAPAKKKSPLLPILIVAGVFVLLVGGALTAFLVTRGGDDDKKSADNGNSESGGGEEPKSLEFSAINERYESVAKVITHGASECVAENNASGEDEKLKCTTPDGMMVLTTYSSEADLSAARARVLDYREGHLSNPRDSGYFYLYDTENVNEPAADRKVPSLYWDSADGLQSVQITANEGVVADKLVTAFKASDPTVDQPTEIESSELSAFADSFEIIKCERIATEYDDELEEAKCRHDGNDVWVAVFKDRKGFREYRNLARRITREGDDLVNTYWWPTGDTTQTEQGKIYGYVDTSGNGVLYADNQDCLCYFQAYDYKDGDVDGDPLALQRDYFNVEE